MQNTISIFFALIIFSVTNCFAQKSAPNFPDLNNIESWNKYSGIKSCIFNGDSISATWSKGMLNGVYKSFYADGKLKSSGNFKNNIRTGKWKLYSENGKAKIVLDFTRHGTVVLHRVRVPGKGGVRFGSGKIFNLIPYEGTFNHNVELFYISGTTFFKRGLKNGTETLKYPDGKIRSESHFKYGLYNGERKIYFPDGQIAFKCEYKDGRPIGKRVEFSENGDLISSLVMDDPDKAQNAMYLDKFDIYAGGRKFIYIDTLFNDAETFFETDSSGNIFKELNKVFENGNLSAYSDESLDGIYFPKHDKPDLSGLPKDEGNFMNIRGCMIKVYEVFNTQSWLYYRHPLSFQPVSSVYKNDSLEFKGGPWLYIPQICSEVAGVDSNFDFLKSFKFPFITSMYRLQTNFDNPEHIAIEQIGSVEFEHKLWLIFYGINKGNK